MQRLEQKPVAAERDDDLRLARIDALETDKRPVSAVADFTEARDVVSVEIREDREIAMTLLFDRDANLEERVFKEQFAS